jgi:hypothetical protein
MIDLTNGTLQQELKYAKSIGTDSLQECIDRLKKTEENCQAVTKLSNDFAPRSFYFERFNAQDRRTGNGGIIFHDITKGIGTAGSPSFSVSLDDDIKPHWQIHT